MDPFRDMSYHHQTCVSTCSSTSNKPTSQFKISMKTHTSDIVIRFFNIKTHFDKIKQFRKKLKIVHLNICCWNTITYWILFNEQRPIESIIWIPYNMHELRYKNINKYLYIIYHKRQWWPGEYTCTATNGVGRPASATVMVEVEGGLSSSWWWSWSWLGLYSVVNVFVYFYFCKHICFVIIAGANLTPTVAIQLGFLFLFCELTPTHFCHLSLGRVHATSCWNLP